MLYHAYPAAFSCSREVVAVEVKGIRWRGEDHHLGWVKAHTSKSKLKCKIIENEKKHYM